MAQVMQTITPIPTKPGMGAIPMSKRGGTGSRKLDMQATPSVAGPRPNSSPTPRSKAAGTPRASKLTKMPRSTPRSRTVSPVDGVTPMPGFMGLTSNSPMISPGAMVAASVKKGPSLANLISKARKNL